VKYLEAKRQHDEGENKALGGPKDDKARRSSSTASAPATSTGGAGGSAPSGPQASPQARQLARDQNIDLSTLKGTGAGGVITVGDVNKAIEEKGRND